MNFCNAFIGKVRVMQVCMPELDDDERIQATAGRLPVIDCSSFLR